MSTLADCRQTVGANVGSPCLQWGLDYRGMLGPLTLCLWASILLMGRWLLLMVEWRLDRGSTPR